LEEDKETLEKAEQFPDNLSNLSNEILKLRAQYLKCTNDHSCYEERQYDLDYRIAGYFKQIIIRAYSISFSFITVY
jgi:hypothetical protein